MGIGSNDEKNKQKVSLSLAIDAATSCVLTERNGHRKGERELEGS